MIDEKQREEAAHFMGLCAFARTLGIAEEIATETYRRELHNLIVSAKVTRFVGIIAERRTRDALLQLSKVLAAPAQLAIGTTRPAASNQAEAARKQSNERNLAVPEQRANV